MPPTDETPNGLQRRRRGRPPGHAHGAELGAERLYEGAARLLEQDPDGFSMRGLARSLGVDTMALYHYVDNRASLLQGLLLYRLRALDRLPSSARWRGDAAQRLHALGMAYLKGVRGAPALVQLAARGPDLSGPAEHRMRSLFDEAVSPLALPLAVRRDLHDLLVDLLHGMALAPAVAGESKRLRSAVAWWLAGATGR